MTAHPLYNTIGVGYDTTRRADPYLVSRLAALLQIKPETSSNMRILDAACGTGNYTIAVSASGGTWTGLELSEVMQREAKAKSDSIDWQLGDVTALPFANGSAESGFDAAQCTLAIHHFPSLDTAFGEIYRALKPGGRFVLFTSDPDQMRGYWICEYFPDLMERGCLQMPAIEPVCDALRSAGFTNIETELYSVLPDLQDFFLYKGKYEPAMYLDPQVRAGISTFVGLGEAAEIEQGCKRLTEDIESGRISEVIQNYENDLGDYIFIWGDKPTL